MSRILFLSMPSETHMNPTLGLARELTSQGEDVVFFSSEEFKKSVQEAGAEFVAYKEDMNISDAKQLRPTKFVDDVLSQTRAYKFDYIVYSEAYPFAGVIARILDIPSVSSLAVFVPLKELLKTEKQNGSNIRMGAFGKTSFIMDKLKKIKDDLVERYKSIVPEDISSLFYNKSKLDVVYG
ncbi:glycosyltransferase [Pinibacter aurantiacus]|uniref:Glycosyl transferase n=1 Tax=Pinibacter aurantiacus TaxID=2851599 RepID=A0A9E2S7T0_9BACT|nr:hypothetical protein [Pinibacter aurantiacus]MBV4357192.1 hypothetical protein [Pinibacter aurantiacus]